MKTWIKIVLWIYAGGVVVAWMLARNAHGRLTIALLWPYHLVNIMRRYRANWVNVGSLDASPEFAQWLKDNPQ